MEKKQARVSEKKAEYKVTAVKSRRPRRPTVRQAARMVARGYAEAFRELEKY